MSDPTVSSRITAVTECGPIQKHRGNLSRNRREDLEPVDSQKPTYSLIVARSEVLITHMQKKASRPVFSFHPSKNKPTDSQKSVSSIRDD